MGRGRVRRGHLVSWEQVRKPKMKGGLRISMLRERKKTFLIKWLWCFPMEKNSLGTRS